MAGFEVTGVDLRPQPRYWGDHFIQADALTVPLAGYDVIAASPPCQRYTRLNGPFKEAAPDLIALVRTRLAASGQPYVIENVPGAPLLNPLLLCGTMFGLHLLRHRRFETHPVIWFPPAACAHWKTGIRAGRSRDWRRRYISVTGHYADQRQAQTAMGIDWMARDELAQAIPPAYTHWIGTQLMTALLAGGQGRAQVAS